MHVKCTMERETCMQDYNGEISACKMFNRERFI